MKKIMILGSAGMLGHMVYHYLKESSRFEITDTSYPQKINNSSIVLNVTDKQVVEKYVRSEKPDIVVNCIGVLIKGSQKDPSNAIYLNSYFPHQLSKLLRETGGRLIHISTDCVFSGKKGAYTEHDFRDADDTYGRSKALGEIINEIDLTLRTSIIGPELNENGEGLFHWFMKQTSNIEGYTNSFWSGVTTLELAKIIEAAIEQELIGINHITNGQKISKYDLICLFKQIYNKTNITLSAKPGKNTDKSLISDRTDLIFNFSTYYKMIEEQYNWMKTHSELYKTVYSL